MKLKFYVIFTLFIFEVPSYSQITPEIYSWKINTTAKGYAGILTNVQQVQYSANNVYISATCIPGYDIDLGLKSKYTCQSKFCI